MEVSVGVNTEVSKIHYFNFHSYMFNTPKTSNTAMNPMTNIICDCDPCLAIVPLGGRK